VHRVRRRRLLLTDSAGEFQPVLDGLVDPALAELTTRLDSVAGLADPERAVLVAATAEVLHGAVWRKVSRVLVLELNAARVTGVLTAADPAGRWAQWLSLARRPGFWTTLAAHYPTLRARLDAVIGNRCAATVTLARRFSTDRPALTGLAGAPLGELREVRLGAGDSHRGGQAVAILRCAGGMIVYKPRPVEVDAALDRMLGELLAGDPDGRIRVPRVRCGDGYGWAEHVEHRYCAGEAELRGYYRRIGHWLAVLHLVGGSDLHLENLIAVGPVPVVVDSETLFTPRPPRRPSGFGLALDRAGALVGESVLRTGLLPGRGLGLQWRGADPSGLGALAGQQPDAEVLAVVGAGTDTARVELVSRPVELPGTNHPAPDPNLHRYWELVLGGFDELTERLRRIDRTGGLGALLAGFRDCPIRVVTRDTQSYVELTRMLWHPASLHDEPAARERAAALLAKHAETQPLASAEPAVIEAEIEELLAGDVPVFTTTPRAGRLSGPAGTAYGAGHDLVEEAVRAWRGADPELDRRVIKAALVSAYLNQSAPVDPPPLTVHRIRGEDLDARRRTIAARLMAQLREHAVPGADGTVTWIAPVLRPTGWAVAPLLPDVYNGLSGVAIVLASYLAEAAAGRADEVAGLDELLAATVLSIERFEDRWEQERRGTLAVRPDPAGGYAGLGSRIWGWLALRRLGVAGSGALDRACALAGQLPESVREDELFDILSGMAGAIVPLLRLAEHTGDPRWSALAAEIGGRLADAARIHDGTACWPNVLFPHGAGGFAHGATGIGWALDRLATVDPAAGKLAAQAFAFEESLYDPDVGGWRDVRLDHGATATWCHGAGGIGVVAHDLLDRHPTHPWPDVLRRAAHACWSAGMGISHTLCHGDLGNWETLTAASRLNLAPPGLNSTTLQSHILSTIEENGPTSGVARAVYSPALIPGIGGIAYQLLRLHPECALPSVLLPDPDAA
jgi:type 2 lantibiotic biosynthesis protein LanM